MRAPTVSNGDNIDYRVKITKEKSLEAAFTEVVKVKATSVSQAISTAIETFEKKFGPVAKNDTVSIKLKPE